MGKYFLLLVPLALLLPSSWATVDTKIIYDAFEEGPFFVNQTDFYHLANPTIDHNLGVFAPNEPGNFPVFYFVTGFGGNVFSNIIFKEVIRIPYLQALHHLLCILNFLVGLPVMALLLSAFGERNLQSTLSTNLGSITPSTL